MNVLEHGLYYIPFQNNNIWRDIIIHMRFIYFHYSGLIWRICPNAFTFPWHGLKWIITIFFFCYVNTEHETSATVHCFSFTFQKYFFRLKLFSAAVRSSWIRTKVFSIMWDCKISCFNWLNKCNNCELKRNKNIGQPDSAKIKQS